MHWYLKISLFISLTLQRSSAVVAPLTKYIEGGPFQCQCSCNSQSNPNNVLVTTGILHRQGSVAVMDSVTIQETGSLSGMDMNQLDRLRESLQVQAGGKMPKDMVVTIVDLFKKALYPEANNSTTISRPSTDIQNTKLSNINGYGRENMQAVIETQKDKLTQWEENEKIKQNQQNARKSLNDVGLNDKSGTYNLRTLNNLIKSATERLLQLFGKSNEKSAELNPNTGSSLDKQAFRNEPVTIDLSSGNLQPPKTREPHGYWIEEKGTIMGNKSASNVNIQTTTTSLYGNHETLPLSQLSTPSLLVSSTKSIRTQQATTNYPGESGVYQFQDSSSRPTVYVTVAPNPSSIAYYKPNDIPDATESYPQTPHLETNRSAQQSYDAINSSRTSFNTNTVSSVYDLQPVNPNLVPTRKDSGLQAGIGVRGLQAGIGVGEIDKTQIKDSNQGVTPTHQYSNQDLLNSYREQVAMDASLQGVPSYLGLEHTTDQNQHTISNIISRGPVVTTVIPKQQDLNRDPYWRSEINNGQFTTSYIRQVSSSGQKQQTEQNTAYSQPKIVTTKPISYTSYKESTINNGQADASYIGKEPIDVQTQTKLASHKPLIPVAIQANTNKQKETFGTIKEWLNIEQITKQANGQVDTSRTIPPHNTYLEQPYTATMKGHKSIGNEVGSLANPTDPSYLSSANSVIPNTNAGQTSPHYMNMDDFVKLLQVIDHNSRTDVHNNPQNQYISQNQYTQPNSQNSNHGDQLAMAMLLGGWRR